jgi:hypothetical protein
MINKKIRMGLKRRLGGWEGNTKKKQNSQSFFLLGVKAEQELYRY